jgi:phosphohistidine phosphatase
MDDAVCATFACPWQNVKRTVFPATAHHYTGTSPHLPTLLSRSTPIVYHSTNHSNKGDREMMLYIVRHAWAGYHGDPQWPDDSQRPLTEKGKDRFSMVVELLAEQGFLPQIVATSPYTRCRETADIIARVSPSHPPVAPLEELAPAGDFSLLLNWTTTQAANFDRIAWVGHAPDVGHLAAALTGNNDSWIRFAKGAVAAIEFEESLALGKGELRWLMTAKLLGC